jgi:Cu2+-exporting ATPase
VDAFRARGWQVRLLSGDDPAVVGAVARQLGLDPAEARGGAAPEQKLAEVSDHLARRAPGTGPVVMVGDGVNDAAALSAADVGVAVHGGAEASHAAADIYLSRPGLGPILELAGGARRTMTAIRRCTLVSLVYNTAAATLAVTGMVSPIVAAVIMPLSSFTVLAMVYRNRAFRAQPGVHRCPSSS